MSKRKQHSPEFKAKVALEALKGVCSGWGQNDTLRVFPVSFHYVEHSVFADAKVTCNPTI